MSEGDEILVALVAALARRHGGNVVVKRAELNKAHGRNVNVLLRENGSWRVKVSPATAGDRA